MQIMIILSYRYVFIILELLDKGNCFPVQRLMKLWELNDKGTWNYSLINLQVYHLKIVWEEAFKYSVFMQACWFLEDWSLNEKCKMNETKFVDKDTSISFLFGYNFWYNCRSKWKPQVAWLAVTHDTKASVNQCWINGYPTVQWSQRSSL